MITFSEKKKKVTFSEKPVKSEQKFFSDADRKDLEKSYTTELIGMVEKHFSNFSSEETIKKWMKEYRKEHYGEEDNDGER